MWSQLSPEELSRDLRHGEGPFLKRRRGIISLSLFSCAVLGTVALYQIGVIKKLPQPGGKAFDTGKVHGSGEAYSMFATPDAFIGLASYAVTAGLAGMGSQDRYRTHPLIAVAMTVKLTADAAMAGKLTVDEFRKFKAFSVWSVLAGLATWTALPLGFAETKAAFRQLKGYSNG